MCYRFFFTWYVIDFYIAVLLAYRILWNCPTRSFKSTLVPDWVVTLLLVHRILSCCIIRCLIIKFYQFISHGFLFCCFVGFNFYSAALLGHRFVYFCLIRSIRILFSSLISKYNSIQLPYRATYF